MQHRLLIAADETDRTGETVMSRFTLRPGLNSVIAAIATNALPPGDTGRGLMATYLGQALEETPEYIGVDPVAPNTDVWNIGDARPTYIFGIGATEKRYKWYEALGAPVGTNVVFVAASLDWRASPRVVELPAGNIAIPGEPAVLGRNNWPDGDVVAQKARLASEAQAKAQSDTVEAARQYYVAAQDVTREAAKGIEAFEREVLDRVVPGLPGAPWQFNILMLLGMGALGVYIMTQLGEKNPIVKPARDAAMKLL